MTCLYCGVTKGREQEEAGLIKCPNNPIGIFHEWTLRDSERKAKRISHPIRYDILDPDFLEDLAKIADYGAKKYGDLNWQLSRLTGDKGPINHIYKHLGSYRKNEPYDHEELGTSKSLHLAAIAFNAMMEYYWVKKEEKEPYRPD